MKKFYILTLATLILSSGYIFGQKEAQHQKDADRAKKVNTRIDNNGYWRKMAAFGLAKLNPVTPVKPAVLVGSEIRAFSVITDDSPDVPVTTTNTTQSENSIFVDPDNNLLIINSNNSTPNPVTGIYGANWFESQDAGLTWGGQVEGAGGGNSGDPVALVGLDGAYYIGAISASYGQSVAKSTDQGSSFTVYNVANVSSGGVLDKNHLWIDNSPISPYSNNLYDAWTDFDGAAYNDIALSRSTNGGVSWSAPVNVSSAVAAGSHCQGVNINSGPNGEVYVIWAVYDGWPTDETAIGLARSFDGGATFEPATRVIQNIRGIRATGVNKNMRNNSFPSMACDISGGEYNGNIYIVWSNVGVPGTNSGNDVDAYISRSSDLGVTWSTPVRINQDPTGMGSKHYFPWITCDPENGILSVIFYDDRNVGGSQCEVYCANSSDGGDTWEDFKVSDVAFTPSPIPGLADGYMGDYLGINARGGWVYPAWADNRTGTVMTYVSPYETNPLSKPKNLTAQVTFETGITALHWSYTEMPDFSYFKIYRGADSVGIAYDTVYNDQLPDYGVYLYKVTAKYTNGSESSSSNASVQWGDARISINPLEIEETLMPDSSVTRVVTINNIGQLEMNYDISLFIPSDLSDDSRAYCSATGTCDEYIGRVQLNEIDNSSACTQYGDYTSLSTIVSVGSSYQITVTNGNPIYPDDQAGLWIDWNQNEVFDAEEEILMNGSPGVGPYTATITPPVGAKPGETRLRTRITYYQTPLPCGATTYGEVEDYTINVLSWLQADPTSGTVPAGQSMEIAVTLSAVDMALGTYTAELNVVSNDPDNPVITVPITMNVATVAVIVTADKDSICFGGSTTLHASITGGSGTFTYSWTSDPPGFTSSDQNPLVAPLVTTTYFVEVSNGDITLNDQITIAVISLPDVNLGADVSVCATGEAIFDAGPGFATYLWSNGQTGQAITVTSPGIYWVDVANVFGCSKRDSVVFSINPLPLINLGADQEFCEGSLVNLTAGSGFASYLWNTGATGDNISTGAPGEYWVEVTDANGCTNRDTIVLTMLPLPVVNLGADQTFCEGTFVPLNAGNGFISYLWNTGETSSSINTGVAGEYWVQVTDANSCSNRDTIVLSRDPLPVAPIVNSGPTSVDNFLNQSSGFTSSVSTYANSYEWLLLPPEAGSISGTGTTAQVTWSSGFTGTANVSVKGKNDCGAGNYSQSYAVSVYSSQGFSEISTISGIKLFPNPNDGIFTLQLNSFKEQDIQFQITASGGNQILDTKESIPAGLYQKSFNLSTLPGGTYYLVISDSHGRMMNRQQIVVQ